MVKISASAKLDLIHLRRGAFFIPLEIFVLEATGSISQKRERKRQTDRQRQTETETETETGRNRNRERQRQRARERVKENKREREKEKESRQTDRQGGGNRYCMLICFKVLTHV